MAHPCPPASGAVLPRPRCAVPHLSVVLPCRDEAPVVDAMHACLTAVLSAEPALTFETVWVDDGSTDATLARLCALQRADPSMRVIALSRGFGQDAALSAGICAATGDVIALIDADLQDPPELLPALLGRWREGADLVCAVRTARPGDSLCKRACAALFYRVLAALCDLPGVADPGTYRLFDRAVADVLLSMPERSRYLRGLLAWAGLPRALVPYRRAPRAAGRTSYSFLRSLALGLNALLAFSDVVARLACAAGLLGALGALACVLFAGAALAGFAGPLPPWVLPALGVALVLCLQIVLLALACALLARLLAQGRARPLYVVAARFGFPGAGPAAPP